MGCRNSLQALHISRADDSGLEVFRDASVLFQRMQTLRVTQDLTINSGLSEQGLLGVRRLMAGSPHLRDLHLTVAMRPSSG